MKIRFVILSLLLSGLAFAHENNSPRANDQLTVIFVHPEKFTDATARHQSGTDKERTSTLDELKRYILDTASRKLSPGVRMEIKMTDIDLAGDFEPWRASQAADLRVMRDIYPPRMRFEFRLTDAAGNVLGSGKRDLTNPTYLMETTSRLDRDPLRYDKALFADWLKRELKSVSPH